LVGRAEYMKVLSGVSLGQARIATLGGAH